MSLSNIVTKLDERLETLGKKKGFYFVFFPLLFIFLYALYFIFCFSPKSYYEVYQDSSISLAKDYLGFGSYAQMIVYFVLLILFWVFLLIYQHLLKKNGRLTNEKLSIIFVILSSSLVVSYVFTLKANAQIGHTDWCMWDYYTDNDNSYRPGHWHVILDIFRTGKLPDPPLVNGEWYYNNQYYQNKLYHLLSAYFMRFNSLFINVGGANTVDATLHSFVYTETEDVLMETTRILCSFYGVSMMVMARHLFKKFNLKEARLSIATFLFVFTPMFIILAGSMNNDCLALLFALWAVYFTIEYKEKKKWSSIIMIGVTLGLGMATKFNVGVIAIYIAGVFLFMMIQLYQKKKEGIYGVYPHPYRTFWLQILVFAAIVFPLGLFFTVYNYVKYQIPFGFIMLNPVTSPVFVNQDFYNLFLRFFVFPAPDMFFSIFTCPYRYLDSGVLIDVWGHQDFNIWTGLFKTTIFGEANFYDYPDASRIPLLIFAYLLYAVAFILCISLIVYGIIYIVKAIRGKKKGVMNFNFASLICIAFFEIVSYMYFNYKYPFTCTMNSRYVVFLFIPLYAAMASMLRRGYVYLKLRLNRNKANKEGLKENP
jgi:hypothetical protein